MYVFSGKANRGEVMTPLPSREALKTRIGDLLLENGNDGYVDEYMPQIMSEIDQYTTTLKERVLAEGPEDRTWSGHPDYNTANKLWRAALARGCGGSDAPRTKE